MSTTVGLTDLEAGELLDGDTGLVEQGLDGRLGLVEHRDLLEQHRVGVELLDLALDDPGHDLLRLALCPRRLLGLPALLLEDLGRHLLAAGVARPGGGDVHRHAAGGVGVSAVIGDQRADRRRQVGRATVQVQHNRAVEVHVALELELLTDPAGQRLHCLEHGAVAEPGRLQGLHVGRLLVDRHLQDAVGELLEVGALGDEVGLAVQLDHCAPGGRYKPVGGGAFEALVNRLGALLT
jgi:hypothetical protein